MTDVARCEREGCTERAIWLPVLELRAPRRYGYHEPANVILALGICGDHKATSTLDDFLGDEAWESIADGFRLINRAAPDRGRTLLSWAGFEGASPLVQEMALRVRQRQGLL